MRTYQAASLLLTVAGCLAGHLGRAQQAPVTPAVAPPRLEVEAGIQMKQPAASVPSANTPQQNRPIIPEPVVILNGRYLMGVGALSTISPQQIDKLEIYKPGGGPVQWRSLTEPGIISLTLKAKPKLKLKARSLAAIKRGLRLHGPVRFEFNGASIQDESLQIVADAIAGLEVTRAAPGTADKTVVNIRSIPSKPAGPQAAPLQPKTYPPGTIIIRGLAQR